ncbi:MAG: NAD(P)-dependent alcohol dehydrogenase [Chryseolinea sp.]
MTATKAYAATAASIPLAPWKFERREVGANDVLFDILFCGVCHSDIHQVRDEWRNGIFPMVPGHEIVGKVSKVGSAVKKFKAGDLVGTGCMVDSCRECEHCKKGLEQYCSKGNSLTYNSLEQDKKTPTYGGYSDKIVVHEDFVLSISDKLDLAAAAPLLCAGITTYSPLKHWKVSKGHKLAIVGLGGLGHMGVKFGVALGAEVTVLSTSPKKEKDAKALGAHKFVVTTDDAQLKGAMGSFDFILDTISAEHDMNTYLGLLKTDGVYMCVGAPPKPYDVHAFSLIVQRKSLVGSMIGGIAETQEMLDFCAEKNIVCDIEMINIQDVEQSYTRMMKGDVRYRFVIDMKSLK